MLPQHQKVPATEKRKGIEIAQEPTNKKKAFEEITNHKMAATKIAEQLKAKERVNFLEHYSYYMYWNITISYKSAFSFYFLKKVESLI